MVDMGDDHDHYLKECMHLLRETFAGLFESASADARIALLTQAREYIQECLDELNED